MSYPEYIKQDLFDPEVLDDERITNGGFNSDTDWTKGDGWSISNGKAHCDGSQTGLSNLQQGPNIVEVGKVYKVTLTVSNFVAGSAVILVGNQGTTSPRDMQANGDYIFYEIAVGFPSFYIQANVDFIGSVDNISCKEVVSPDKSLVPPDLFPQMAGSEAITAQNDRDFSSGNIGSWTLLHDSTDSTLTYDTADVGGADDKQILITVDETTDPCTYARARLSVSVSGGGGAVILTTNTLYKVSAKVQVPVGNTLKAATINTGALTGSIPAFKTTVLSTGIDAYETIHSYIYLAADVSGFIDIGFSGNPADGDIMYIDDISIRPIQTSWIPYGTNTIEIDEIEDALKITFVDNASGAYLRFNNDADLIADLVIGENYLVTFDAKAIVDSVNPVARIHDGSDYSWTSSGLGANWASYSATFTAQSTTQCLINFTNLSANEAVFIRNLSIGLSYSHGEQLNDVKYAALLSQTSLDTKPYTKEDLFDPEVLDSDVITNGEFNSDTDWTKGDGWSISNGKAHCDGSQAGLSNLQQGGQPLTAGILYKVTLTISNYSAGSAAILLGNTGSVGVITVDGDYVIYGIGSGYMNFYISANASFAASIDNVTCKAVLSPDKSLVPPELWPQLAGDNLIANSVFATTAGWVGVRSTIAAVSGELRVTATGDDGYGYDEVATVDEQLYRFEFDYYNTLGDVAQYFIYDIEHSVDIISRTDLPDTQVKTGVSGYFTATGNVTRIALVSKLNTDVTFWDNVYIHPIQISWAPLGNNTIEIDEVEDALKITYVDDPRGGYLFFKDSADLISNLVIGEEYLLQFDAKVDAGTVFADVYDGSAFVTGTANFTTNFVRYNISFVAQHTTGAYIRFQSMAATDVVYIRNLKIGLQYEHDYHIDDLEYQWLKDKGAVGDQINDLWRSFLIQELAGDFESQPPFYDGPNLFDQETLGSEVLTDPEFDTACGVNWTCGTGWTIAGGILTGGDDTAANASEAAVLAADTLYKVVVTVDTLTAGGFQIFLGSSNILLVMTTADTYIGYGYAEGNTTFYINKSGTGAGTISSVSVKEVTAPDKSLVPPDLWPQMAGDEGITLQNDRDFSSGTIGTWTHAADGAGTFAYNTDAIGGADDKQALLHSNPGGGGAEDTSLYARLITTAWTCSANTLYRFSAKVYVPAGNTNKEVAMSSIAMTGAIGFGSDTLLGDTWTEVVNYIYVAADNSGYFILGFNGDPTNDDKMYFDDISIRPIQTSWTPYGTNIIEIDETEDALKLTGDGSSANGGQLKFGDIYDLVSDLIVGQSYSVTFDAKVATGDIVQVRTNDGTAQYAITGDLTDAWVRYELIHVAGTVDSDFLYLANLVNNDVAYIRNMRINGIYLFKYQYNDYAYAWLGSLGYTGQINDRWLQLWSGGGIVPVSKAIILMQYLQAEGWLVSISGRSFVINFGPIYTISFEDVLARIQGSLPGPMWSDILDGLDDQGL